MQSKAATVEDYLAELSPERRELLEEVLAEIRPHMPAGLSEEMGFGMINWVVPLAVVPDTYNGKPLSYAALASQKNYVSLYLMTIYGSGGEEEFRAQWQGAKKLNMGKSCVRFTSVADIDLELIKATLDRVSMADYIATYETTRSLGQQR